MIITTDGISLTSEQQEDIEAGCLAMGNPEGEILVTTGFESSVRSLTGLKQFSADRGSGTVAAKTIGTQVIINASVLHEPAHGGLKRLTAHEAGHVLMNARGEDGKNHHSLATTQWQWNVISLAVKGMEECRIERRLAELGFSPASPVALDYWDVVLFETNADLVESVLAQQSVDSLVAQVIKAADLLITTMAYTVGSLANPAATFAVDALPPHARRNWDDFVASTWDRRVALYEALPTCSEAISASDWESKIKDAWSLERALFKSFGWELSGNGQELPEAFRRTGSDDLFRQRIARFQLESQSI
ncbi:hypothetical protein J2T11_003202 [Paenarthrobacter nicotinovorans]|uniref:hypothetical protein n=1 Tax=Paenarthrobacter nicotinovorans TaxID=29320 RepID=UPI00277F5555|nr:hypothetical protein [Paenarthrobacter nicotinovorans]MDP9936834.1 hypothetical protein [Paenarthrobacter nicotinovorans]